MPKTVRNAAGQESAVRTFHEDGTPEIRISVLAFKKRVDFHLFDLGPDQWQDVTLLDLLDIAEDAHNNNASKIEIGVGNLSDFDFTTVKDLKQKLGLVTQNAQELSKQLTEHQSEIASLNDAAKVAGKQLDAARAEIAELKKPKA